MFAMTIPNGQVVKNGGSSTTEWPASWCQLLALFRRVLVQPVIASPRLVTSAKSGVVAFPFVRAYAPPVSINH